MCMMRLSANVCIKHPLKAVKIIQEGRGSHFDPDMTDVFIEIHETFREIAIEFADHEEEREALRK